MTRTSAISDIGKATALPSGGPPPPGNNYERPTKPPGDASWQYRQSISRRDGLRHEISKLKASALSKFIDSGKDIAAIKYETTPTGLPLIADVAMLLEQNWIRVQQ